MNERGFRHVTATEVPHDFQMTAKRPVFQATAERQLGIGVVGLNEGQTLLTGLSRAAHARGVAGCDVSDEKLAHTRAAHPELFLTQSYEAMLERDDIDIVAIYTPDQFHGSQIVQAMEAGKDVICTKPLVNTIEDARFVLETGRATGRRLQVGQSCRFFESFKRQRAAFEQGEVGEVELADAHYNHRMDWYYDKSAWVIESTDWVFLGLSHPIDLVRWYLGPIEEVSAVGSRSALGRRYALPGNDMYLVNLRSRDGRIGRAMGNYGLHELPSARNCIELVLYGSDGTSMAQYHDMRFAATRPDGTEVWEDALYANRAYYFNNEVHGMHFGEFANYTEYFAKSLLEDVPNSPDLEEGIDTFCVMESVRRSVDSGKSVLVDNVRREVGL
jgi:predicted dehydrogenase